jgi:ABC-type tungstate transport system substrate-binding protein
MKSVKKALLFGFLVWVIPFVVAILIFSVRNSDRPLFESIMPVVVTLCVVIFASLYLKNVLKNQLREGILLGVIWLAISLVLDLIMFMPQTPMHMSIIDYGKDIGLTYVLIPAITIGFGYQLQKSQQKTSSI